MPQLTWLITGCSSGFGEQFVRSILARGDHVIATGRDILKLQNLKEEGASILQLDITSTQQAINETVAQAISIYGKVDVLLNNAGYVSTGIFEDLTYVQGLQLLSFGAKYLHNGRYEDFLAQFETNVFGTIKVTQALLPQFRQRRAGTMVFIGSLSGWMGDPGISAYVGSKFALEGTALPSFISYHQSSFANRDLPNRHRGIPLAGNFPVGNQNSLDRARTVPHQASIKR
jgi:NAD(P)-dependent dehydrogenase (short-subunit alcohol dehydrogenase family)